MSLGIDIDLNVDWLEEHLADECKCQANHPNGDVCSVKVTHMVSSCISSGKLVCQVAADYTKWCIANDVICTCWKLVREHWRVIPV